MKQHTMAYKIYAALHFGEQLVQKEKYFVYSISDNLVKPTSQISDVSGEDIGAQQEEMSIPATSIALQTHCGTSP